jgi:hypothetical protein
VRFGAARNLSVGLAVPYGFMDSEAGDSESGLGDITLNAELRAYEDVVGYPYVMPHANVALGTGDEEQGLGTGETLTTLGRAAGTTTYEIFHWVADARYTFHEEGENVASLSAAFIWDLGDAFAVHVEGRVTDEERGEGQEHPGLVVGGMSYEATENLTFMAYGGGGKNTEQDVIAAFKAAYSF